MPERVIEWYHQLAQSITFGVIGIIIGVGQLLGSEEKLTARVVIGRALSTGGIAMGAGSVLAIFPDLPYVGQIGIAAVLASLGTSGLEKMVKRILGG